jgi:DNA-binding LacI/PurR family transcriptional regulator
MPENVTRFQPQENPKISILSKDLSQSPPRIHPPKSAMSHSFFIPMLGSVTQACKSVNYDLLISFQDFSRDWHADFDVSRKADGIILLGYGDFSVSRPRFERLVNSGTHFIRYGSALGNAFGLSVGCDNYAGGAMATQHLIDLGRERIAFLGLTSERFPESFERYRGYADALTKSEREPISTECNNTISTMEAGYSAAWDMIKRGIKFDALFCASDIVAIGALHALHEHGINVPNDVSLVGYDDMPVAKYMTPSLTTIRLDTELAGRILVDTLLKRINEEAVSSTVLPVCLAVRDSCGAKLN